MATISEFKSALIGGGFRPNQFRVILSFPNFIGAGIVAGQQAQFLCKSSMLPGSDLENIQVSYKGRPVNFAGERTFSPWQISVYADTSFNIRNAFEQWSDGIQNYDSTFGKTTPSQYQVDMNVYALDRSGAIIKTYKFFDAYPVSIGPMGLDFDANNQIATFDVVFQYNYFVSQTGREGGSFGVNLSIDTPIGTFPLQI
jgi:hypothetical protein